MAFSIIATVWGVIIYLIYLLVRIKKMGNLEQQKITKASRKIKTELNG